MIHGANMEKIGSLHVSEFDVIYLELHKEHDRHKCDATGLELFLEDGILLFKGDKDKPIIIEEKVLVENRTEDHIEQIIRRVTPTKNYIDPVVMKKDCSRFNLLYEKYKTTGDWYDANQAYFELEKLFTTKNMQAKYIAPFYTGAGNRKLNIWSLNNKIIKSISLSEYLEDMLLIHNALRRQ